MKFKRRKMEVTPPYVSMADIVFNLVLFFLILARTQESTLFDWEPAKAKETKKAPKSQVTITVSKATDKQDRKIYLNAQEVGIRELAERLTAELGTEPGENRVVLLRIDKETPAATFEPILEAVSQTGCEVVHVLDEEQ
ncbi:ExbD/TolR family protein [Zavarzinella formosa]|uniref:ExbD/TolR family protein n=1 Tax=Zavarzinella formosa TaxID=360055 RepID=UPI0002DA4933|nr:biopolymer transporter ExbD [Zavarzinella formosa]